MKLLVGAVDSTYASALLQPPAPSSNRHVAAELDCTPSPPLLSYHVSNISYSYDCKDDSDSAQVASKGGNAPRLMQGTVSPGSLSRHGSDASRSSGQLSRGGSVPLVHEFSDNSDDEEEPLSAEQQLRRRLGQLGN